MLRKLAAAALEARQAVEDADQEQERQSLIEGALAAVEEALQLSEQEAKRLTPSLVDGDLVVVSDQADDVHVAARRDDDPEIPEPVWQLTLVRLTDDRWTRVGDVVDLADLGALLAADT